MTTCPHCGSRIDRIGIDQLANIRLSIVRRTILNGLVRAYPGGLSNDEVRKLVWGSREPLYAEEAVRVHIRHLRVKLEPFGWKIPTLTTRPKQKPYRLEPAHD